MFKGIASKADALTFYIVIGIRTIGIGFLLQAAFVSSPTLCFGPTSPDSYQGLFAAGA
jgi:hypothetical protein